MKYRFLKLSVFCSTTYFFTVSVYADIVQLDSNNDASTDRLGEMTRTLSQGSYTDGVSEPQSDTPNIRSNDGSKYSNLKVEKKAYYPDSSIHTINYRHQTWWVNCRKKKFDNEKSCYMNAGDLWVFLINGKYSVNVGNNHYPRTKAGLKIDNGSAIYGYEGELPKPLSIIERLKKGKVAYTRYQEWPYQYDTDEEVSLKDFTKQFNEMIKQYKNL